MNRILLYLIPALFSCSFADFISLNTGYFEYGKSMGDRCAVIIGAGIAGHRSTSTNDEWTMSSDVHTGVDATIIRRKDWFLNISPRAHFYYYFLDRGNDLNMTLKLGVQPNFFMTDKLCLNALASLITFNHDLDLGNAEVNFNVFYFSLGAKYFLKK